MRALLASAIIARPALRFVTPKTESQQTLSVLHRVRESMVRERTRTVNQMHGFLLEFGHQSAGGQDRRHTLPAVLAMQELPPRLVVILGRLHEHFKYLEEQIGEIDQELARQLADDEVRQRLTSIPEIGPVTASALAAKMGDAKQYGCSRDFAASVGLVPRQYCTGGKANLLGINRRGDKKGQAPARPVRPSLHARPGETNRPSGRVGSRNAGAAAFKRGGVRAGQHAGPNRLGHCCAPNHIRRWLHNPPGLNEHSFIFISHNHPTGFATTEN
jgi:hypothetical protein